MKNFYNKESGRSMVEMLGVLAVIGVLSVAGIAGYRNAMNKHRANTLLNEASKRATIIAMQRAQGNATLSVSEFGTGTVVGAVLDVVPVGTEQFAITISTMNKAVCQNIINTIGENTQVRYIALSGTPSTKITTCGDDGTAYALVYNNDLSITDLPPCNGHGTLKNGICTCDYRYVGESCNTCSGDLVYLHGSCQCPEGKTQYGYDLCTDTMAGECIYNNDCNDNIQCIGENCICKFGAGSTTGTCTNLPQVETVVVFGKNFYRLVSSDRFSTTYLGNRNLCSALGKKTVTANDLGCSPTEADLLDHNADRDACSDWGEVSKLGWRWYNLDGPVGVINPTEFDFRSSNHSPNYAIGVSEPLCTDK